MHKVGWEWEGLEAEDQIAGRLGNDSPADRRTNNGFLSAKVGEERENNGRVNGSCLGDKQQDVPTAEESGNVDPGCGGHVLVGGGVHEGDVLLERVVVVGSRKVEDGGEGEARTEEDCLR